jgi:nucleoside-diphosphate-sugar epimerase
MQRQKVLVTGPTGNLGLPLVRALAPLHDVWAVARFSDPERVAELEGMGVRCVRKDLASDSFDDLPEDFDSVFHGASLIPMESERDMATTFEVNTQATARLFTHCRHTGTFVFCSTAGVYRHQPRPLRESDEYGADVPAYALSKISAEQLVRYLSVLWSTPTIILRIGALYGPDGGSGGAFAPIDRLVQGKEIWVNPTEPRGVSLLWEDDAVRLAQRALGAGQVPPVVVNFCGDEQVSVEEYCTFAGELLGLTPRFRYTEETYPANPLDTTVLHDVLGRGETGWRHGIAQAVAHLYPDLMKAGAAAAEHSIGR